MRIEGKVDGLVAAARLPERKEPLPEGECLRVFRLFGELLAMGTELGSAPGAGVRSDGFQTDDEGRDRLVECQCVASLITRRVALIEGHFGLPMESYAPSLPTLRSGKDGQG